ncbi:hypothetical protein SAMN05216326_11644 [Nitrosomonas marina]|uniref:Uncharacterized protein n=1 Tax=Nitrosomonas marina TaxID=917 RepID=A0A1I0CUB4_9PROT|nr:hypothetical protein [Nitrosomonas marina]SET23295.1 hypothetical protein SAMN05216326_11644 [Nitrosomonas marina]
MKTKTLQNIIRNVIAAFIVLALPMSVFAAEQNAQSDRVDHDALIQHYEAQADEMLAKIDEQIDALKHKSRSSFFGKHGQDIKSHVKYKIHEYEKAAEESLEKAAYHKQMAEEREHKPVFAGSGNTKG